MFQTKPEQSLRHKFQCKVFTDIIYHLHVVNRMLTHSALLIIQTYSKVKLAEINLVSFFSNPDSVNLQKVQKFKHFKIKFHLCSQS